VDPQNFSMGIFYPPPRGRDRLLAVLLRHDF
jgi:hypothetical protein